MRAFRGLANVDVPADFQLHHLLPVGVFTNRHFSARFERLRADGFDPRFYALNGVALPATERAAAIWKLPLHRGPHTQYNELVAMRVAAILRDSDSRGHLSSSRYDAVERLNLLISTLRQILSKERSFFLLNQRDPMHSRVNFTALDQACDLIWHATK